MVFLKILGWIIRMALLLALRVAEFLIEQALYIIKSVIKALEK